MTRRFGARLRLGEFRIQDEQPGVVFAHSRAAALQPFDLLIQVLDLGDELLVLAGSLIALDRNCSSSAIKRRPALRASGWPFQVVERRILGHTKRVLEIVCGTVGYRSVLAAQHHIGDFERRVAFLKRRQGASSTARPAEFALPFHPCSLSRSFSISPVVASSADSSVLSCAFSSSTRPAIGFNFLNRRLPSQLLMASISIRTRAESRDCFLQGVK